MIKKYNELIISSGGIKGFSIIGALYNFFQYYPLNNINYYTGTSVGALICTLLNLEYNINELKEIMFHIDFSIFQDLKVIHLIENCGFDNGIKFNNFLKALFLHKNINHTITFKELFSLTNKCLTIVVTNVTKGFAEYHNYITTPNLSILLSLKMSTNVPILFSPIIYNNDYYLDGGLLDPFPYFYNKHTIKIGFWLFDNYEFNFINNFDVQFIKNTHNIIVFIITLLKMMYSNYIKQYYKKIPKNVIQIHYDCVSVDFKMDKKDKIKLFHIGQQKTKLFLHKIYKKNRKRYLAIKYFYLWKEKILLKK
jgi:hypothetical protein